MQRSTSPPYLFVFGGLQDNVKGGTSNLFVINIMDLSVDILDIGQQFTSAGHSALKLSDDCIMVSGGVSKQFFTYSSKAMAPSACDHKSLCKIMESSETSPIAWIMCESKCKGWYHQFCEGVLGNVTRGKYCCKSCKNVQKSKKSRQT